MRLLKEISDLQYLDIDDFIDRQGYSYKLFIQLLIESKEAIALATVELADAIFLEKRLHRIIGYLDLVLHKHPHIPSLKWISSKKG